MIKVMSDFKFKPTTTLWRIKTLLKNDSNVFVVSGGQGSGKTISILMLIIDYASRNEKKKISIISSELSKMKKTVIKDFLDIMRDWNMINLGRWNISENTFTFNNGTFIDFLGLDVHDVGKGMRRDLVYFNEANKLKLEAYRQVASRSKLNIIDFNPDSYFWGHDLISDNNFINTTFRENEYLPKSEVNAILDYYNKGYNEDGTIKNEYWANVWRVYGLGEIGSIEGRIFTHFQKITYNDYLTKPFKTVYAIDFGKNDPTAIIEGKFDRAFNNLYVNELNYASENQIMMNLSDFDKQKLNSEPNGGVVVYLLTKLGVPKDAFLVCDSARPDHILTLRRFGWEYAYGIDKPKGSIMHGISQLQATNVFYTENSNNLDFEYQNYRYKKDRLGVIDDEAEDDNNHLMDALRYLRRHFEKNN